MSQELHYTSVPRGLRPGSSGFGTVAATANLPDLLAERLEGLSAYRAVFAPDDRSAALNPVAFVHVRLSMAGRVLDVLSRIGPAGLDYSGRPNKYAHHVVLEPDERPDGGPAWLMSQPGFFQDAWQGEPRVLAHGPVVPAGDRPAGIARQWQVQTGDAGWAGVLAEAFLADPRRPVFLVYRPGIELLPLFVEAIALLPAARRWDVEFSTYPTSLPPGVSCTWRGVLEGSAEARSARRLPGALIVDLLNPMGRAQGAALVHLARTGERIEPASAGAAEPSASRLSEGRQTVMVAGAPPPPPGPHRPGAQERDWLPDLAARLAVDESLSGGMPSVRRRRSTAVAICVAACLLVLVGLTLAASSDLRRRLGFERRNVAHPALDPSARPAPPPELAAPAVAAEPSKPPDAAEPPPAPALDATAADLRAFVPGLRLPDVARASPPPDLKKPPPGPGDSTPAAPPLIVAVALPDVPASSLGSSGRRACDIPLPRDADERIAIRNAADLRLTALGGKPPAWEVATRSGSGLGGGFALARLARADARTWHFEWTRSARARSAPVEGMRDAVLELHADDGRPLYVLLRGIELRTDRPLDVWKSQKILGDRLEPKIRPVEWTGTTDALDGSRWRPSILRWRLEVSPAESEPGKDGSPARAVDSGPDGDPVAGRDLIPGEVQARVAIAPDSPGFIDVRIEPDADKVRAGREQRAARRQEFEENTPRDRDGQRRDPLAYRRAKLAMSRDLGSKDQGEVETFEREVRELETLNAIRQTEELLGKPARVALSVVIGLEVEKAGIVEIARIGNIPGSP